VYILFELNVVQRLGAQFQTSNKTATGTGVPTLKDVHDDDDDTKKFRFCTKKFMTFCGNPEFKLGYLCSGDHYDEFGSALESLAATLPEPMGRRPFPVAANKTVLVMGNSHTRQMILALMCQYSDEIVEYDNMCLDSERGDRFMVRFRNDATILSQTNSPIVYSPTWPTLIETISGGRPLKSFDGIVLGKFNAYEDSKGTSFVETMSQALKDVPGNVDFTKASPPSLKDVAGVYEGPIVYVGMFAKYGMQEQSANKDFVQSARSNRDNLSVIDGRKYINMMKMECGALSFDSEGLCLEKKDEANHSLSRAVDGMHRCTGDKGGHPDLIAWEVAEKLNRL